MTRSTRPERLGPIALALLSALTLHGCGGGADADGGGASGGGAASAVPNLDACALVTAADAAEALGGPASQPAGYTRIDRVDDQMGTAISNCVYATESYRTLSVVVSYRRSELPATFEALKADASTATGAMAEANEAMFAASQPVSGLGDFAFWMPDGGGLTVYALRHYQIVVNVDPPASGGANAARAAATAVADKILSRL